MARDRQTNQSQPSNQVTYDEVAKMGTQGKLPFGQVPVLQLDGETFAQTQVRLAQWTDKEQT